MIQDKTNTIQESGNLPGNDHELGIDAAAMAHIMSVLTDLYSDPELAVIREYSTNAWDAHVEAGNSDPIHVTLPSPLSPFFKVRDYGVGLSEDDIENIYSRYGSSTKRQTNTQVGMLGLGCKSALTYVQQFTVVSVKDGERIQVAVTRTENGGKMKVVDRRPTDEPNGTEITIPAKRDGNGSYDAMVTRAKQFFAFWPTDTVLLNGKPPERAEGMWLNDEILVRPAVKQDRYGRLNPQHRVVMGHVAYPVELGRLSGVEVAHGYEVCFFVGIGAVNFVPSREALNYDERTLSTLKSLTADFTREAKNAVQREVNSAKTGAEAIEKLIESRKMLADSRTYGAYTYKGQQIPSKYEVPGAKTSYPANTGNPDYRLLSVPKDSYVQNRADEGGGLSIDYFTGALWVTGYEGVKFSAPQKKKLLKYAEEVWSGDGTTLKRFILVKDEPTAAKPWIAKGHIVKWSDVNAVKLDRVTTGYGSYKNIPGSYDNCIVDGTQVSELAANDIDQSKPIYWYAGSWYHLNSYTALVSDLAPNGYTIVPLPENRRAKFLRNFAQAEKLTEAVEQAAKDWAAKLSTDERVALAQADQGYRSVFRNLPAAEINDPDIKRACKLAQIDLTSITKKRKVYHSVLGRVDGLTIDFNNPLDKYPLIESCYNVERSLTNKDFKKHIIMYLNTAFAA